MWYIGIDNGLNGGIVCIDNEQKIVWKKTMPVIKDKGKTEYSIYEIIKLFEEVVVPEKVKVHLEKAYVRPISGKRACFMNGYGYGLIQGILESLNLSYEIVTPQTWMKNLEINSKNGKGSILFCQRKWPKEKWCATERSKKPHDGLTDAACLALYCYRMNR